jgi:hypothetical protein
MERGERTNRYAGVVVVAAHGCFVISLLKLCLVVMSFAVGVQMDKANRR